MSPLPSSPPDVSFFPFLVLTTLFPSPSRCFSRFRTPSPSLLPPQAGNPCQKGEEEEREERVKPPRNQSERREERAMMKGKGGREKVGFFLSLFQTSAFAEEEKGWREGEREKYVFSPFSPAAPLSKSGPIFHVSAFPPSAAKEEKASTRRHRVLLQLLQYTWAEGNRRQSLAVRGSTGC